MSVALTKGSGCLTLPSHCAEIRVSRLYWDKCSRVVNAVFASQGNARQKGKLKSSLFPLWWTLAYVYNYVRVDCELFMYWLYLLNLQVKWYRLNHQGILHFCWFAADRCSSVAILNTMRVWLSCYFRCRRSVTWCLDCVKVFMRAKSFDTPPHASRGQHPSPSVAEQRSGFQLELMSPSQPFHVSTLIQTKCLDERSANWIVFAAFP